MFRLRYSWRHFNFRRPPSQGCLAERFALRSYFFEPFFRGLAFDFLAVALAAVAFFF
jgi:hypothetical protein